jgi:3-methyladenine DNA glycosylase AlkD
MTKPTVAGLKRELRAASSKTYASNLQWFFKTGPGEYGEGDIFLGVRQPQIRKIAKPYRGLSISELNQLLGSRYHEERMAACVIMADQFPKADETGQRALKDAYLKQVGRGINNWDLIDVSCHKVVGAWLATHPKDRKLLDRLAKSDNLWERRVAIVSTFGLMRIGELDDCMHIAKLLLKDEHDLIHKAVGWVLREVGKRNIKLEEQFLQQHYQKMPRTMLRYAIEKFPEERRQQYLKGRV